MLGSPDLQDVVGGDRGKSKPTECTSLIAAEPMANPQAGYGVKKLATIIITYCRACSWLMTFLTLLFYVLTSGASVAAGYWLAEWSDAEENSLGSSGDGNSSSKMSNVCDQENGPSL